MTNNEAQHLLVLNVDRIEAARSSLNEGAVTPGYGPNRDATIKLLNDGLATELVCTFRHKRHHSPFWPMKKNMPMS